MFLTLDSAGPSTSNGTVPVNPAHAEKDNSFRQFRRLCAEISEENRYTNKTQLVSKFIKKGTSGSKFFV